MPNIGDNRGKPDIQGPPGEINSRNLSSAKGATRAARGHSSFEARFGRVILEHGIAAIPAGLFHFQKLLGLDAKHLWFIAYILSCKWDADLPYPSLNKMERCTGVNIQALYRYKKALISQGYLSVCKRLTDRGGFDTDAYDFSALFDGLEECIVSHGQRHGYSPNPIHADGPVPSAGDQVESDTSFVARYGRVIVRYGVAAIPKAIFTYQKALQLTPQQIWFVGYILSFRWDSALPFPSLEKMAANTGYNRSYLHEIKSSLANAGYLHLVHRTNEQGGQDTNAYDFSGLFDAIRRELDADREKETKQEFIVSGAALHGQDAGREPLARTRSRHAALARADSKNSKSAGSNKNSKSNSREVAGTIYRENPGINKQTGDSLNGHTQAGITEQSWVGHNGHTAVGISRQTEVGLTKQIRAGIARHTDPVVRERPEELTGSRQGQVSNRQHESEEVYPETIKRDDSNHLSQMSKKANQSVPERGKNNIESQTQNQHVYSSYIASVITDFSDELGNSEHVVSNVTQALRLWQESRLNEQQFVERLYEAKRRTRQYQGRNGINGIQNKMAYLFVTLRQLAASKGVDEDVVL